MGNGDNIYLCTMKNGEQSRNIRSCLFPDTQKSEILGTRREVEILVNKTLDKSWRFVCGSISGTNEISRNVPFAGWLSESLFSGG